jgi:hypothetical protein
MPPGQSLTGFAGSDPLKMTSENRQRRPRVHAISHTGAPAPEPTLTSTTTHNQPPNQSAISSEINGPANSHTDAVPRGSTPSRSADVLAIELIEPGERADELLAAIAATLHFERIESAKQPWEIIHVPVDDHPATVEAAEDALEEAGADGRLIVGVLRPS